MLTSRSNAKIKFLESLRKSRERKKSGLFLVEGEREIERAGKLESLFFAEENAFVQEQRQKGVECILVAKNLLERISLRAEPMGIGKMVTRALDSLEGSFFVALVGVEKPGNIGAILRTCDGVGVDGVLLVDPLVDHYHPNAIRASLAASLTLPIVLCSSKEAFAFMEKRAISLYVTSPAATKSYVDTKMEEPLLVAMGQEDRGLPEHWMKGTKISLPMHGICDSLNVSVATGVVLYEVLRQNGHRK